MRSLSKILGAGQQFHASLDMGVLPLPVLFGRGIRLPEEARHFRRVAEVFRVAKKVLK